MISLAPVRISDPDTRILSLADAKEHLKVESSDEDALITAYIAAAEGYLDGYSGMLGQALITQQWSQGFNRFPYGDRFRLPLGPLQQIDSISYYDEAGALETFSSFHGISDAVGPMVVLQDGESWPATATRPDAVTVTWTCGFGDDEIDVPMSILQATKLLVGEWHFNRANSTRAMGSQELPFAVRALIGPHSKVGL